MTVEILQGDCRVLLGGLPEGSIHTCVTSPPYYSLRDYGTPPLSWPAITYSPMPGVPACMEIPAMECSLGLEPTLEAFIGHIVLVFREVRRVLRDDGTCWVNMGDSYAGERGKENSPVITGAGSRASSYDAQVVQRNARQTMTASRRRDDEPVPRSDMRVAGLKNKDMLGQPWRVAFALQADGWWMRSDIIWNKKNPMPESTKDRPTKAHEYLFLLAKSDRYYYDADAIKEPVSDDTHARYARGRSDHHKHAGDAHAMPGQRQQTIAKGFGHMLRQAIPSGWATGTTGRRHDELEGRYSDTRGVGWGHGTDAEERNRGRVTKKYGELTGQNSDGEHRTKAGLPAPVLTTQEALDRALHEGKGRRKLAEDRDAKSNASFDAAMRDEVGERNKRTVWTLGTEGFPEAHFATYPTELVKPCILAGCPPGGTVLDPFGGAATTGVVADRLGRNAILCELNPDYVGIGQRRLESDKGHVSRQLSIDTNELPQPVMLEDSAAPECQPDSLHSSDGSYAEQHYQRDLLQVEADGNQNSGFFGAMADLAAARMEGGS